MAPPVQQVPSAESVDFRIDPAVWRDLAVAHEPETFYQSWLAVQVQLLPGVRRALVLHFDALHEEFVIAGCWPHPDIPQADLIEAGGDAISERHPMVSQAAGTGREYLIAYPLDDGSRIRSVAVFSVASETEQALKVAMSRLQWGSAWLEVLSLRQQNRETRATLDHLRTLIDLVAATAEQSRYEAAISAMVTELAARLGCERVSFAEYRGRRNRVKALSHSGQFGKQMTLINSIGRAMDEATDQGQTMTFPARTDVGDILINRFHSELSERHGRCVIVTVPMAHSDRTLGALCFEYPAGHRLDDSDVELCDAFGALFAPILADKQSLNRPIIAKNLTALKDGLALLVGPRHLVLKTTAVLLVIAGIALNQATADYNITADAVLEGAVQRVVVAPFDGYVTASYRRAGDRVLAGDLLGELDDRDLRLELIQLASERAQAESQQREAQAAGERARTRIFQARIDQADARIDLVRERIERTQLRAPFDGIVLSGDLSQSLGAVIERGEVLFEIAPLDDYRIILRVDERDIDFIALDQLVSVVLSALPDERIVTGVNKITPVSNAADGRNYFRVEAHYQASHARLRPGMEGVAKITIDQRPLLWIWTRELVDWFRLWIWRWIV